MFLIFLVGQWLCFKLYGLCTKLGGKTNMYDYPLDAIGQYFEMPTKEAFLDKVKPTLTFIQMDDVLMMIGVVTIVLIGVGFAIRNSARRH